MVKCPNCDKDIYYVNKVLRKYEVYECRPEYKKNGSVTMVDDDASFANQYDDYLCFECPECGREIGDPEKLFAKSRCDEKLKETW